MRAAIFTEVDKPLSIETVDPLPPGPSDVVVRVDASGVCHSDLSVVRGWVSFGSPIILGHEGAGTVLEVGKDVSRVKPGDTVIASFVATCGHCFFCLNDQSNHCESAFSIAPPPRARRADGSEPTAMTKLGTFADVMTVDETSLVKVETDLPAEQLALIGCGVTTGVGAALNTAQIVPGSTVAVIGCGGVGQSVIQGARIAGAARIIAVDPVALKRETALGFGATDVVDPTDENPVKQVKALTSGRGVDYAFEVIGYPETMAQAYAMARNGGTAVIVGMPKVDAQFTIGAFGIFASGKRLLGSMYGSANVRRDFPRLVRLAETKRLDLDAMVSRRIALDEVNEAFRAMDAGETIRSVIV